MAKRAYDYYYEGTVGDDQLDGSSYRDLMYGRGGRDTINGYASADILNGEEGADNLIGGAGNDELCGGEGADRYTFAGNWGQDQVYDYDYNGQLNTLYFSERNKSDAIYERDGEDLYIEFVGRSDYVRIVNYEYYGDDFLFQFADGSGGPGPSTTPTNGDDVITGTAAAETIDALDGNDTVRAQGGDDVVGGNYGNDFVYGEAGNDRVNGAYGDDFVYGGDGNDNVRGGPGYDLLYGGAGQDDFDFDLVTDSLVGSRRDVIYTFTRGPDDIDITGIGTGKSGQAAFKFVDTKAFTAAGQVRETVINGDTVIQGNTDADRTPEFEIGLDGRFNLAASDFAL